MIFRYFDIRNFEIPKYWSFYIPSFEILTHAPKISCSCFYIHFLPTYKKNFSILLV